MYARVPLGILFAMIALFNFWMAPQQLATVGMFGAARQPQYGLLILGLGVAIAALALLVMLIANRWTKPAVLAPVALILLVALSAYAFYAGITA